MLTQGAPEQTRGRLIPGPERLQLMEWVESACDNGASQVRACEIVGISARTLQRWKSQGEACGDGRASAQRPTPGNRLTDDEREHILSVCNSERFRSLPPSQIVPTLLDEGVYIGSVSSLYRVLKAAGQQHHRGRQQKPAKRKPATHKATAPNQLWSWDISWLNSPMKGSTMLSTLHQLGVMPSFSRPRVSNDNAYSEALFRTLKYRPAYPPQAFDSLQAARDWVQAFVTWYNEEHRHSGLKFQAPLDRHTGRTDEKIRQRVAVLSAAKERNPERWGSRPIRDWWLPDEVVLNPEKT